MKSEQLTRARKYVLHTLPLYAHAHKEKPLDYISNSAPIAEAQYKQGLFFKAIIDALRINPVDYISDNDLDSAAKIEKECVLTFVSFLYFRNFRTFALRRKADTLVGRLLCGWMCRFIECSRLIKQPITLLLLPTIRILMGIVPIEKCLLVGDYYM